MWISVGLVRHSSKQQLESSSSSSASSLSHTLFLLDQRTQPTLHTHTTQPPRHHQHDNHVDVRQQLGGTRGPEIPGSTSVSRVSPPSSPPSFPSVPPLPYAPPSYFPPSHPYTNSAATQLSQSSPLLSTGMLARSLIGSRAAALPTYTSNSSSRRTFMSQGGAGEGGNVRSERAMDG